MLGPNGLKTKIGDGAQNRGNSFGSRSPLRPRLVRSYPHMAVAVALRNVARWPPAVASTAALRPRTFPFSANTIRFSANFIVPIVYPPLFAEPRPVLRLARAVGGFDQVYNSPIDDSKCGGPLTFDSG